MANDKNLWDDLDLSGDYGAEEGFSLESILAEYKGSAFLDGDKKTPAEELQRKTDDILREVLGENAPAASAPARPEEPEKPEKSAPEPAPVDRPGSGDQPMTDEDIRRFFDSPAFERLNRSAGGSGRTEPAGPLTEPVPERETPPVDREPEPDEPEPEEEKPRRGLFRRKKAKDRPVPEPEPEAPRREAAPRREYGETAAEPAYETPPEPAYETPPEIDLSAFEEPEPTRREGIEKFIDSLGGAGFDTPVQAGDGGADYAGRGAEEIRDLEAEPEEDAGEPADFDEEEEPQEERPRRGLFGRRAGRENARAALPEEPEDDFGEEPPEEDFEDDSGEEEEEEYYDIEPDPDFKRTAMKYAARIPSLRFRLLGLFVLSVLMILTTWLFSTGRAMPLLGHTWKANTAALLIMELLAAALGMDVLTRGFQDILTLQPGAESLVFVSTLMSVADGFAMLVTGNYERGLPMAVLSVISLMGAVSARKSMYMAYCDSLRGAKASSNISGVASDADGMEGRRVLKKVSGETFGFYAKLTSPDFAERFYDDLAPLLVIVSFVMAFLSTVGHGNAGGFTHAFSIMTAVCAAFPATALFALPFKYAAAAVKRSGGALAGWVGAQDISDSDGALITDLDVFPVGSVKLDGVKMFEGVDQQKVISAASSVIITSDSGLRRVFEELLKSQNLARRRVDDFACYDGGGIGGLVDGERVLVGTGAFMSLMGLRVPDAMNAAGNVFAAINDELTCFFTLSYVPASSVQSALVALLGTRTNILMAVRDFNVTPNTISQRFKVSMDGVEYLPIETAYALSQNELPEGSGISAVLCRGGLAPFAEVITRGRLLRTATLLNTAITCAGTAIGAVVMFYLCWAGAFAAASALNLLFYMSLVGAFVYIMSQIVKKRIK